MNNCKHFKSLVQVKGNTYFCTTCGWFFLVHHQTGFTITELSKISPSGISPEVQEIMKKYLNKKKLV